MWSSWYWTGAYWTSWHWTGTGDSQSATVGPSSFASSSEPLESDEPTEFASTSEAA